MRCIWLLVLLSIFPSGALARCVPFDLLKSLDRIRFVVHGSVTESNKTDLLSAACNPDVCRHRFRVDVLEVLKGKPAPTQLWFEYEYRAQRPEISLFGAGEQYVFAIGAIRPNGQATLYGTTCGRAGLDSVQLEKIKAALRTR